MDSNRIKLYGGYNHGRFITVDKTPPYRIETMPRRLERPRYFGPASLEPPKVMDTVTYHVHRYHQQGHNPRRYRSLLIGVIEGCELFPREENELNYDMEQLPWSFPSVSFLHEFEEWWSQCVYRHTGRLTWRGEPVYW